MKPLQKIGRMGTDEELICDREYQRKRKEEGDKLIDEVNEAIDNIK